ncbi:MAG: hypothetical protein ACOY90_23195 [Candidatus Zhuqueibacterota bacterium]
MMKHFHVDPFLENRFIQPGETRRAWHGDHVAALADKLKFTCSGQGSPKCLAETIADFGQHQDNSCII